MHGVEALYDTERAQDEFFHLFEALKRRGARVMLVADRAPSGIAKIDERLRSRFEGGLVVEVDAGGGTGGDLELVETPEPEARPGLWEAPPAKPQPVVPPLDQFEVGDRAGLFVAAAPPEPSPAPAPAAPRTAPVSEAPAKAPARTPEARPGAASAGKAAAEASAPRTVDAPRKGGSWFPSSENVVIHWPKIEELLQEELD